MNNTNETKNITPIQNDELNEEQTNWIMEALKTGEVDPKAPSKVMRDIIQNPDAYKEDEPLQKTEVLVSKDPVTGESITIGPADSLEVSENVKPLSEIDEDISKDEKLSDAIKENLKGLDMDDSDVIALLKVMQEYSKNKKSYSVYNNLPEKIKTMIKGMAYKTGASSQAEVNLFAKMLIDSFISDAMLEKEFVNLEESIKKELAIPNIPDLYTDYIRDMMEDKLLAKADILEKNDYPDKAQYMRDVSNAFTDSYTLKRVIDLLTNNSKIKNKLTNELGKYNRFCDDFEYKFKNSKFQVHPLSSVFPVLCRVFPDVNKDILKMFSNVLYHTCENLDSDSLVDTTYAYYVIKNIIMQDYTGETKTQFSQTLCDTLNTAFTMIEDLVDAKYARKEAFNKKSQPMKQYAARGQSKTGPVKLELVDVDTYNK